MAPHILLRRLQARLGISQAEFARACNISRQNFNKYISGHWNMSPITAERVEAFTGVPRDYFIPRKKVKL